MEGHAIRFLGRWNLLDDLVRARARYDSCRATEHRQSVIAKATARTIPPARDGTRVFCIDMGSVLFALRSDTDSAEGAPLLQAWPAGPNVATDVPGSGSSCIP